MKQLKEVKNWVEKSDDEKIMYVVNLLIKADKNDNKLQLP